MDSVSLELPSFFDAHVHLREPENAAYFAQFSAAYCATVLAMPNLREPLVTGPMTVAYTQAIEKQVPGLRVLPVLYLTDETTPKTIREAKALGVVAAKLYPAGTTTGSEHGVHSIAQIWSALAAMQEVDMVLCCHGEDPAASDVLGREYQFIVDWLMPMEIALPQLRIVIEHITTREAVLFMEGSRDRIAATITAHHMVVTLNDLLGDKLRPTYFCKPVAKFVRDRKALVDAATSGSPKFFFGSDSAPHSAANKFCDHGCAGCFTAPIAHELLATVFEQHNSLPKLADFASGFASDFYGIERPKSKILLRWEPHWTPKAIDTYPIFRPPGTNTLPWRQRPVLAG